jgi:hypothetical protein
MEVVEASTVCDRQVCSLVVSERCFNKNEGKMKSTVTISYGKQTIIDANLLFKHKGTTFGTASVKALGAPKMYINAIIGDNC